MRSAYNGPNRYSLLLKAGKSIAAKISKLDGVVGILATGEIGRGFGDVNSDLDMIVYVHEKAAPHLRRMISIGWISYKGIDYDIIVESYERADRLQVPSNYWSQIRRWDLRYSRILYDHNGHIKRLLERKLIYPEKEQVRLLNKYRMQVQEHLIFYPEIWMARGQLYNLIDTLIRGVENIILWIYARNLVFEPYAPKWLFFYLETKAIPEFRYLARLTEIYSVSVRTKAVAMNIRKSLISLCDEIGLDLNFKNSADARRLTDSNWKKISDESRRLLIWK